MPSATPGSHLQAPGRKPVLHGPLTFTKGVLRDVLRAGDIAVDATVGNGYDTVFLASQVGANGRVFGFDIQPEALEITRRRLAETGVAGRVTLIEAGHERMRENLPDVSDGSVQAIMFNLGYLPGGDKAIVTRPETTLAALDAAVRLLAGGGLLSVVMYRGHPGGQDEADQVEDWARSLDQAAVQVLRYAFINQRNRPPVLLLIEKITPETVSKEDQEGVSGGA